MQLSLALASSPNTSIAYLYIHLVTFTPANTCSVPICPSAGNDLVTRPDPHLREEPWEGVGTKLVMIMHVPVMTCTMLRVWWWFSHMPRSPPERRTLGMKLVMIVHVPRIEVSEVIAHKVMKHAMLRIWYHCFKFEGVDKKWWCTHTQASFTHTNPDWDPG